MKEHIISDSSKLVLILLAMLIIRHDFFTFYEQYLGHEALLEKSLQFQKVEQKSFEAF